MPNFEITEVVLVYYNIVNNNNEQDSRVSYTFTSNKTFGQSLDTSPKTYTFKVYNSEFSYIQVWFTDQNSTLLEIEVKINIPLVINWSVKWHNIQYNLEKKYL